MIEAPSDPLGDAFTERIFCYGTLLDPIVQLRVIGRRAPVEADVLPGYRKDILQAYEASYFIAVAAPDGEISGGVISVSPSELRRIDEYEGPEYERVRVVLRSGRRAWVYRRPPGRDVFFA